MPALKEHTIYQKNHFTEQKILLRTFIIPLLQPTCTSRGIYDLICCSVTQSCPALCDPMNCSMPGFLVLHYLPELAQTHVHWVNDAIQPSHPLLPTSLPDLNLPQHQGLFQWFCFSNQVAKVLELQVQHSPSNEYSRLWWLRKTV